MYVYVHTCTHSNSSRKGTKKNSYMQIYEGKSAEFLNFVREMGGFESKEVVDWENYRDDKSIILIILVTKKGREKYGIIRYHSIPTETDYQSA